MDYYSRIYLAGQNNPNSNCSKHGNIKLNRFLEPQWWERSSKNKSIFYDILLIHISNNLSPTNIDYLKVDNLSL